MTDLTSRLVNRMQLTTDGHGMYLESVEAAFHRNIDYAILVKIYGTASEEKRYSSPVRLNADRHNMPDYPDTEHISTSYVERQNLSMRMGMRLTNAFSRKLANHMHALSIYFMHHNFVWTHETLRCTPAMEAGVTDRLWSLEEMIALADEWEAAQKASASN